MSDDARKGQAPLQVVSDLGQLKVFTDALKVRILRLLQHQELSIGDIAALIEESEKTVAGEIRDLMRAGMLHVVREGPDGQAVYRAIARIFNLHPDRGHEGIVSSTITGPAIAKAMAESVGHELATSLTTWPDQLMNLEGRRARMSHARALEFNDKLVELISEYWGGPNDPIEENSNDPLMSFMGIWYRFPEKS